MSFGKGGASLEAMSGIAINSMFWIRDESTPIFSMATVATRLI